MPKNVKIKRALISVSDKTGLIPFAKMLAKNKVEILSTGGTLKALKKAKIPVVAVDSFTEFPEILEGRVKTLHPKIHGGLLYRRGKKSHVTEAKKHGIQPIDLVVVNLYPFEAVTANPSVSLETAIENIDIGGPSMLRSAAKNCESVSVVCDINDFGRVIEDLKKYRGAVSEGLRYELANKVFERTSAYDRVIHSFLKKRLTKKKTAKKVVEEVLPEKLEVVYAKSKELRYGENPHQRAAFYTAEERQPRFKFEQLHGKELSFNNLLDIEATIDILREFKKPAACVVKHSNPCGVAENQDLTKALELAIKSDSLSAFGGIVGVTGPCDRKAAKTVLDLLGFFEVLIAPSFDKAALKLLKARKNLRLIQIGDLGIGGPYDMRFIKGGILVQDRDKSVESEKKALKKNLKFVTKTKLSPAEMEKLIFAWKCVKNVKSNAIVLTQGKQTVGIGAGQMSRVDSVFMACKKAGPLTMGSYLASDAFFPMPDAIEEAHKHQIRAIIQPGGSIRDKDIIDTCNRFGIAMALTGKRHFKH